MKLYALLHMQSGDIVNADVQLYRFQFVARRALRRAYEKARPDWENRSDGTLYQNLEMDYAGFSSDWNSESWQIEECEVA